MVCCLLLVVFTAKCYMGLSPVSEQHSPVVFVMQINVDDVSVTSVHLVRTLMLHSDQKSGNMKKQALIHSICYPVFLSKSYTLFLFFNQCLLSQLGIHFL